MPSDINSTNLRPQKIKSDQNKTVSPVYALMWRLHLYAGILIGPIILWSSITGILFVFSPQIESILYSELDYVKPQSSSVSYDEQLAAAIALYPNATPTQFIPSSAPNRSSEIAIATPEGRNLSIYVDPHAGTVRGQIDKSQRFVNLIRTLHGNLGAGNWGRLIIELGTSWLLVLLVTGIILWFPRKVQQLRGIWLPRLMAKGKVFWRDLHSITGIYFSGLILLFALTGLVWTQYAGGLMAIAQDFVGQGFPKVPAVTSTFVAEREPISLQKLSTIVELQGVSLPYRIELPKDDRIFRIQTIDNSYEAIVNSVRLQIEQYNGTVLSKLRWEDYPLIPKLKILGICFHEGSLFGLANQILCAFTCGALVFFVFSGAVLWWKRRPQGKLKIPTRFSGIVLPKPLRALIVTLCFCLPTVGISLVSMLLFDRLAVQRRNQ